MNNCEMYSKKKSTSSERDSLPSYSVRFRVLSDVDCGPRPMESKSIPLPMESKSIPRPRKSISRPMESKSILPRAAAPAKGWPATKRSLPTEESGAPSQVKFSFILAQVHCMLEEMCIFTPALGRNIAKSGEIFAHFGPSALYA